MLCQGHTATGCERVNGLTALWIKRIDSALVQGQRVVKGTRPFASQARFDPSHPPTPSGRAILHVANRDSKGRQPRKEREEMRETERERKREKERERERNIEKERERERKREKYIYIERESHSVAQARFDRNGRGNDLIEETTARTTRYDRRSPKQAQQFR